MTIRKGTHAEIVDSHNADILYMFKKEYPDLTKQPNTYLPKHIAQIPNGDFKTFTFTAKNHLKMILVIGTMQEHLMVYLDFTDLTLNAKLINNPETNASVQLFNLINEQSNNNVQQFVFNYDEDDENLIIHDASNVSQIIQNIFTLINNVENYKVATIALYVRLFVTAPHSLIKSGLNTLFGRNLEYGIRSPNLNRLNITLTADDIITKTQEKLARSLIKECIRRNYNPLMERVTFDSLVFDGNEIEISFIITG